LNKLYWFIRYTQLTIKMSEELIVYEENRANGLEVLRTVLKSENNIKIIEKYVDMNVNAVLNDEESEYEREKKVQEYTLKYNKFIYDIVGDVVSGINLKDILNKLKTGLVGWKHPVFDEIRTKIEEHDEFIMNPFEVEEGALTCAKCGCNKTYSYSKQTRSADEPMSTFAQCLKCKAKWVYSG
jgi:DNA-directed RNA polymerase subunit M/transcription elongation factor TFIIS